MRKIISDMFNEEENNKQTYKTYNDVCIIISAVQRPKPYRQMKSDPNPMNDLKQFSKKFALISNTELEILIQFDTRDNKYISFSFIPYHLKHHMFNNENIAALR